MNAQLDNGNRLLERRDYSGALQAYSAALKEEPASGALYQGIAECYSRLKRFDEASSAANKALELNSNLAVPHTILAYAYHHRGDYSLALIEAQKGYALAPDLQEVGNCYGALLLGDGRVDESIRVLNQVLQLHKGSELAHQNLAVAYREKRDFRRYVDETLLAYKAAPTLAGGVRLLAAYQQRYALAVALITLGALAAALLTKLSALLIIPALMVIQGLIADFMFVLADRFRRKRSLGILLFSLLTDTALGAATYIAYLGLRLK